MRFFKAKLERHAAGKGLFRKETASFLFLRKCKKIPRQVFLGFGWRYVLPQEMGSRKILLDAKRKGKPVHLFQKGVVVKDSVFGEIKVNLLAGVLFERKASGVQASVFFVEPRQVLKDGFAGFPGRTSSLQRTALWQERESIKEAVFSIARALGFKDAEKISVSIVPR
ncbi:MAG: hypothetical protein QXK06_01760 [Candidatus Diapherotrites archaeon]